MNKGEKMLQGHVDKIEILYKYTTRVLHISIRGKIPSEKIYM